MVHSGWVVVVSPIPTLLQCHGRSSPLLFAASHGYHGSRYLGWAGRMGQRGGHPPPIRRPSQANDQVDTALLRNDFLPSGRV